MNKTIIEYKEPDSMYDYLFDQPKGKYNTNVKLSNEDKANGTRILCKEPYAQSLYNLYNKVENYDSIVSKDLNIGEVYEVSAISYNTKDRLVSCEEINSKTSVYVPYSELKEGESITSGKPFSVMITQNRKGVMYGSVKKCAKIVNFKKLDQYLTDGTIFDVKIINLIKGGFIAMFDDSLECFIPGAHAAANIIYDFNSYIGRTIKVMVDNYDQASNLYVVSHKKYIKNILPQKINDLEFGKKYQGKLTSQPTKFGIFVEFNEIFTGLIHIAEFDNYESFSKTVKQGDFIDIYITRVLVNDGNYKINLTLDPNKIDSINLAWSNYKTLLEGKEFDYSYDTDNQSIKIIDCNTGNDIVSINVPHELIKDSVFKKNKIKVIDVNVISKQIGFDFV